MINSTYNKILTGILLFFFLANIFDFGGAIGIKYFSYIPIFLFFLFFNRRIGNKGDFLILFFLFLVFPFWFLIVGIINGADFLLAFSQITPFFAGFLFLLFSNLISPKKIINSLYFSVFILSLSIILLFFVFLLMPSLLYSSFFNFLLNPRMGYFGTRFLGELKIPIVYFRATLFLVPAYVFFLFQKQYTHALICCIAMILAFSKASILLALFFGGIFLIKIRTSFFSKLILIIAPFFLLCSIKFFFPVWLDEIIHSITGESNTMQVRIIHFISYLDFLKDNPLLLISGQGAGSLFFTDAVGGLVSNIEIDHINSIRKFGLIWFAFFSFYVFFIAYSLIKKKVLLFNATGWALLSSFIASGTNPVLISPVFFILFVSSIRMMRCKDDSKNIIVDV